MLQSEKLAFAVFLLVSVSGFSYLFISALDHGTTGLVISRDFKSSDKPLDITGATKSAPATILACQSRIGFVNAENMTYLFNIKVLGDEVDIVSVPERHKLHFYEAKSKTDKNVLPKEYFVLTNKAGAKRGAKRVTHILKYEAIDPGQRQLKFTDLGTGTRKVVYGDQNMAKLVIAGITYLMYVDTATGHLAIDQNGDGVINGEQAQIVDINGAMTTQETFTQNPACAAPLCSRSFAPVCGSDGKTYDNDCLARAAGVSVTCNNSCPCGTAEFCTDTDGLDYYTKGYVTVPFGGGSDCCLDEKGRCTTEGVSVQEIYCDSTNNRGFSTRIFKCPNGCRNGACLNQSVDGGTRFNQSVGDGTFFSPGEYPIITGITPILGDASAPLKIVFVNVSNNPNPNFAGIVSDTIRNEFKTIPPFSDNFNSIAFYTLTINYSDYPKMCGNDYNCIEERHYTLIQNKLKIIDSTGKILTSPLEFNLFNGILMILIDGTYPISAFSGNVIWIRAENYSNLQKNMVIHEVGHVLGLGDFYLVINGEGMNATTRAFNTSVFSKAFFNIDNYGCPKWCSSFKPVEEYYSSNLLYNNTAALQCTNFTNKQDCLAFGFSRRINKTAGGWADGCSWAEDPDEPIDYFNSRCVPSWGSENIGIGCMNGTGCYWGACGGGLGWRPILRDNESIMFSHLASSRFDPVSESTLSKVLECCFSSQDESAVCAQFRKDFAEFLKKYSQKKRLGSCGFKSLS